MKLKKIASLMLAGIMAVSMLAACGDKAASSTPTQPEETVDNSFAAAVNEELSDKAKETLKLDADADLTAALKTVSVAVTSDFNVTANTWLVGGISNDFRSLLGLASGDRLAGGTTLFTDTATSNKTVADLLVMTGNYTDKGLAKAVADKLDADIIDASRMPAVGDGVDYRYEYSGNIDVVEVENLTGNVSVYLIGVEITQTAVEVDNV